MNVSDTQQRGFDSLVQRRAANEVVYFQTDKSGRMTADDLENFTEKMTSHFEGSKIVSLEEVDYIEKVNNSKSKCWMRIVNAGEKWGHGERMKQAVSTVSGMPPPIYGLPKDHKQIEEGEEPPVRPVCGANCGPGSRISNILAQLIDPFNEAISGESQVQSTEDLQAKIEAFNREDSAMRADTEVFSMDVKALYPSLDIEKTATAVEEVILESEVKILEIEEIELARYVAAVATNEIISFT